MKISIITLHAVVNYGSALQTYATQKIFESLGMETQIIDYRREAILSRSVRQILTGSGSMKEKLKGLLLKPSYDRGRKVFDTFLSETLNLTEQRYTYDDDFERWPLTSDIYCTGSDQVWNSGWHDGVPRPFYLSFVREGKKISFAASFGKDRLSDDEKPVVRELLSTYDAISVREAEGLNILRDLGFSAAVHVLDPTVALDPREWLAISEKRVFKAKYILIYQLCNNADFDRYAVRLAREKGLKLVRLCIRYDQLRKPGHGVVLPPVESFVSLVRHAEYVLTDSFHCTAFSIMMHKQFVSFYPNKYASRLKSILELTGLRERLVEDYADTEIIDRTIPYERIDHILAAERNKTMRFLRKAVDIQEEK